MIPPAAVGFCLATFVVFLILLVSCCYRQIKMSKEVQPPPLLPRRTSSVPNRRYITTIDVQTGMPVVVDLSAIFAHSSEVQVVPSPMRNTSINGQTNSTMYGSIFHDQQPNSILSRTPPPAYSEVPPYQPTLSSTKPLNGPVVH